MWVLNLEEDVVNTDISRQIIIENCVTREESEGTGKVGTGWGEGDGTEGKGMGGKITAHTKNTPINKSTFLR